MAKKRKFSDIHPSVRDRLGYTSETDEEIYADWKERTSRVCKPCWELKYCPYGPFVEQSPLLPALKAGMKEKNDYFIRCLATDTVGELSILSDDMREYYAEWADDDQILLAQALNDLSTKEQFAHADKQVTDQEKIDTWQGRDLPPIEVYRIPFSIEREEISEGDYPPSVWREIRGLADSKRIKYLKALETGEIDNRGPLEPARRLWFQQCVDEFRLDEYPESIPPQVAEAECNIFGHICPVFLLLKP